MLMSVLCLYSKAYSTPTVSDGVVLNDGDGAYHKSQGLNEHEGVAQIVTGHGRNLVKKPKGISPVMRKNIVELGSVFVEIESAELKVSMINGAGEIRDEFSIVKKGEVESSVVEDPWAPTKWDKAKK